MKKIAIVGSGISGLTSAFLLKDAAQVTIFEKEARLGGHTNTVEIPVDGKTWNIDTGFIVFNNWNYPNFLKLVNKIGLDYKDTEMSFSVHNPKTKLEYNGNNLASLFCQKNNLISPRFYQFLYSIIKFNRLSKQYYFECEKNPNEIDHELTLQSFLDKHQFNDFFKQHYILPMGAAIWSMSLAEMLDFPLYFFIRFFYNHGLLNISNRPQWHVVEGGSKSYIPYLTKEIEENIFTSAEVTKVKRHENGVSVSLIRNGEQETHEFDEVILACHSDQALAMLADATEDEKTVLQNMRYSDNEVVLHQDRTMLPENKGAWASWNYFLSGSQHDSACVTYNMNILQSLPKEAPLFCVTLNQTQQINPEKILKKYTFSHPVFDQASMSSQKARDKICGKNRVHFAGAYWYNGFHEDGVKSALDVCRRFGVDL